MGIKNFYHKFGESKDDKWSDCRQIYENNHKKVWATKNLIKMMRFICFYGLLSQGGNVDVVGR
jgi:adenylate cyclase